MAAWAQTATVLAADLLAGNEDPRPQAAQLLRRALAALPAPARAGQNRVLRDVAEAQDHPGMPALLARSDADDPEHPNVLQGRARSWGPACRGRGRPPANELVSGHVKVLGTHRGDSVAEPVTRAPVERRRLR